MLLLHHHLGVENFSNSIITTSSNSCLMQTCPLANLLKDFIVSNRSFRSFLEGIHSRRCTRESYCYCCCNRSCIRDSTNHCSCDFSGSQWSWNSRCNFSSQTSIVNAYAFCRFGCQIGFKLIIGNGCPTS